MGPTILECRGPRKPPEQGRRGSDVLACPGEVWEGFLILDDLPVQVAGHGARTPTVSVALDLSLELRAFLLELESCFFELLVPRPQLLYPQVSGAPASTLTSSSRSSVGVAPPSWMLSMYPSGVAAMKHSRDG